MKKKVLISGGLKDFVIYCTAIYKLEGEVNFDQLKEIVSQSPIFEDKNFYTNVLGTVSKTTVTRKCRIFYQENKITIQLRYELLKVVDIDLTESDEEWIRNDIKKIIEHFELLLSPAEE